MKNKIIERGIIEVKLDTGEILQWFYSNLKELKELKNAIGVESYNIISPLITER